MQKTVIMVWLKTDSGTHSNGSIKTYGLGDLLRGTIYLHQMSVHFGFKFVVDLRLHPISQHLIVNEHDHMEYVNANVNKIKIMLTVRCSAAETAWVFISLEMLPVFVLST